MSPLSIAMTATVHGMSSNVCAGESTGARGGEKMEEMELVDCVERALILDRDLG